MLVLNTKITYMSYMHASSVNRYLLRQCHRHRVLCRADQHLPHVTAHVAVYAALHPSGVVAVPRLAQAVGYLASSEGRLGLSLSALVMALLRAHMAGLYLNLFNTKAYSRLAEAGRGIPGVHGKPTAEPLPNPQARTALLCLVVIMVRVGACGESMLAVCRGRVGMCRHWRRSETSGSLTATWQQNLLHYSLSIALCCLSTVGFERQSCHVLHKRTGSYPYSYGTHLKSRKGSITRAPGV